MCLNGAVWFIMLCDTFLAVCVCQPPSGQALPSGCEAAGRFTAEMFIIMKSDGPSNAFDAHGLHGKQSNKMVSMVMILGFTTGETVATTHPN